VGDSRGERKERKTMMTPPTLSEIREVVRVCGRNSEAPQLWRGIVDDDQNRRLLWPIQKGMLLSHFDVTGGADNH